MTRVAHMAVGSLFGVRCAWKSVLVVVVVEVGEVNAVLRPDGWARVGSSLSGACGVSSAAGFYWSRVALNHRHSHDHARVNDRWGPELSDGPACQCSVFLSRRPRRERVVRKTKFYYYLQYYPTLNS